MTMPPEFLKILILRSVTVKRLPSSGGMAAVSGGLTAAIVFGFIFALIFKSHPNKR